jgi:hypothetical protein
MFVKVAVQCESPLLQRAFEHFLDGHLTALKQSDIVIRDRKVDDGRPMILVDSTPEADLRKPFSRSQLMMVLEGRLQENASVKQIRQLTEEMEVDSVPSDEASAPDDNGELDFSILEKRIEKLTQEYQQNVLKAVRAFYER